MTVIGPINRLSMKMAETVKCRLIVTVTRASFISLIAKISKKNYVHVGLTTSQVTFMAPYWHGDSCHVQFPPTSLIYRPSFSTNHTVVGHGGALVEAITLNRRVVGSTPALAAM